MTETQETKPTPNPTPVPTPEKTPAPKKEKEVGVKNLTMPLKDIELSEDWNREKLGDVKGLVQSLKEIGQKVPLVVRRHPKKENKVMLVDGRRRYAALQEAGIKEALISFSSEASDLDAFETSMVVNEAREPNNAWEKSCGFQKLIDGGKNVKGIARTAGRSEGFVSQHLAAQKVHKKLQAALKADKIPLSAIRHFARLDYEADTSIYDKLMDSLIDGSLSAQDVGDKIDVYVDKKEKAEAAKETKEGGKGKGKKAKAEKKRPGPKVQVTDYTSAEVKKLVKMIGKEKALEWLIYYGDKLKGTNSAHKRAHYQGVIEGLEIASGLIVEN